MALIQQVNPAGNTIAAAFDRFNLQAELRQRIELLPDSRAAHAKRISESLAGAVVTTGQQR